MATTLLMHMLLGMTFGADLPDDFRLPAPPGSLEKGVPGAPGSTAGTPLIATSYFYWYDAETRSHMIDADGTDALTDHPPTLIGFSYKNVDWHARQRSGSLGQRKLHECSMIKHQ